jgi:hypothetical protein
MSEQARTGRLAIALVTHLFSLVLLTSGIDPALPVIHHVDV